MALLLVLGIGSTCFLGRDNPTEEVCEETVSEQIGLPSGEILDLSLWPSEENNQKDTPEDLKDGI